MFLTESQVCLGDNEKRQRPYDIIGSRWYAQIFLCRARTHAHYLHIFEIDRIFPGPLLNVYKSFATILQQLVIKYTVIIMFMFRLCSSLCLSVAFWFKCHLIYRDNNRVGIALSAMELYIAGNIAIYCTKIYCTKCSRLLDLQNHWLTPPLA